MSIHSVGLHPPPWKKPASHTVWLADDNTEVSILMPPLWYVLTHGIPLNWQRLRLLIRTGGERTPIFTVPMSP